MRRIAVLLVAVVAMSVGLPVWAAEMTQDQKNECLLATKGCLGEVDTLQEKIRKLETEIKKGNRVYTPAELKRLNDKLKEAETVLDELLTGGGP